MKLARFLELAQLHSDGHRQIMRCDHECSVDDTCELTLVSRTGTEVTYLCCESCAAHVLKNLPTVPEA